MSIPDTPAVPVSLPAALDEWERLARAAIETLERYRSTPSYDADAEESAFRKYIAAKETFERAVADPERILGLIAAARRALTDDERSALKSVWCTAWEYSDERGEDFDVAHRALQRIAAAPEERDDA